MPKNVKHIIFDLGNVILNIDYQLTVDAFAELGVKDFQHHFSQHEQSAFMDDFEMGKVSAYDFIEYAKQYCTKGTTPNQIVDAWNALLLDIPIRRLQILQQLQLDYNLFLLSNTNIIHEEAYTKTLRAVCGYENFSFFFDRVYLSHRVGMRKPNAEIFQLILNENNLKASETLFIDDSIQHIEGAKKLGIQTIHLTGGLTIEADIFKPK